MLLNRSTLLLAVLVLSAQAAFAAYEPPQWVADAQDDATTARNECVGGEYSYFENEDLATGNRADAIAMRTLCENEGAEPEDLAAGNAFLSDGDTAYQDGEDDYDYPAGADYVLYKCWGDTDWNVAEPAYALGELTGNPTYWQTAGDEYTEAEADYDEALVYINNAAGHMGEAEGYFEEALDAFTELYEELIE